MALFTMFSLRVVTLTLGLVSTVLPVCAKLTLAPTAWPIAHGHPANLDAYPNTSAFERADAMVN